MAALGRFALQLAKSYGADVTGVDSTDKLDMLRSIGADHVIDFTASGFHARAAERYDLIVDVPGNHSFADCRRVLTPDGSYVLIGHDHFGEAGHRWLGSLPRFLKLVGDVTVRASAAGSELRDAGQDGRDGVC